MAIRRTFRQAYAKALRSRELDKPPCLGPDSDATLLAELEAPRANRFEVILELLRRGTDMAEIQRLTSIDPWFLRELQALAADPQGPLRGVRSFRSVDTCAASSGPDPLLLLGLGAPAGPSAGGPADEVERGERESVVILGAGPNRIGQGIEFDYCCVHAAMTVRESGRDAVMINCNPETVSTDYDTSDRLYFEPLTLEDVLAVIEAERAGMRRWRG